MKTSEQINEISAAMAKAQAVIGPASKDSINPAYKSRYADLASVWAAWQKVGPEQGLAVWQDATTTHAGVAVTTLITHASGQWLEFGPLVVPVGRQDAHGVGSATTYAKRFGFSAAVGIVADDDDDGNTAVEPRQTAPAARKGRSFDAPRPAVQPAQPEPENPVGDDLVAQAEANAKAVTEERRALVLKASKLAGELGMSDDQKATVWSTYCGEASPKTVDPAAVQDLVKFLQLRIEQKKAS